jgi:hypothetical protein
VLADRALELLAQATASVDDKQADGQADADAHAEADQALRLAGHLVESAWLAAPHDPAVQQARQRVFSARAGRASSTMARGVFNWAASEAADGAAEAPAPHAH